MRITLLISRACRGKTNALMSSDSLARARTVNNVAGREIAPNYRCFNLDQREMAGQGPVRSSRSSPVIPLISTGSVPWCDVGPGLEEGVWSISAPDGVLCRSRFLRAKVQDDSGQPRLFPDHMLP